MQVLQMPLKSMCSFRNAPDFQLGPWKVILVAEDIYSVPFFEWDAAVEFFRPEQRLLKSFIYIRLFLNK